MSFNKPSMNGLNNFDVDEIETLITNNTLAISNKQNIINSSNRLSATLIGNNGNVSNNEYGYLNGLTSNIQTKFDDLDVAVALNTAKVGITTHKHKTLKRIMLKLVLQHNKHKTLKPIMLKLVLQHNKHKTLKRIMLKLVLQQHKHKTLKPIMLKLVLQQHKHKTLKPIMLKLVLQHNKHKTLKRIMLKLVSRLHRAMRLRITQVIFQKTHR